MKHLEDRYFVDIERWAQAVVKDGPACMGKSLLTRHAKALILSRVRKIKKELKEKNI
jgi:hypothetical protein